MSLSRRDRHVSENTLKPQLNAQHPLVKLAETIDWQYFEREFPLHVAGEVGRPSLPTRLMVGLHYLKALYDESDESLVQKWTESCLLCQKSYKSYGTVPSKFTNSKNKIHPNVTAFMLLKWNVLPKAKYTSITNLAVKWLLSLPVTPTGSLASKPQIGNPYDGATLKPALEQVTRLTGITPNRALVDQGFRGLDYHPRQVEVLICDKRKRTGKLKRLLKRRSAIEPIIGHSKQDHGLQRNYLQGRTGDQFNALLAGCGFNLRKLYRFFESRQVIESAA